MVDLDGAAAGEPKNMETIFRVISQTGLSVEVGGGIRSLHSIERYLNGGAARIILGSVALKEPDFAAEAISKFGEAVAIGIDAKQGMVRTNGWLKDSQVGVLDLAVRMDEAGVSAIIYTDISRDGTLSGPNIEELRAVNDAVAADVIASGGIRDAADIRELAALGLSGAICGKSIYQGTIDLTEAIAIAGEQTTK
jgi:phosphoribosylformimino-5-aminoimidazole carboxamide ribotide isomerase